jgi:hypothetical protein
MVGEYFLHPERERIFTVGGREGVDFEMGDAELGGPSFALVELGQSGATVRFTRKMQGHLRRRFGEEMMTLAEAKKRGLATEDGDGLAIALQNDDFVWIDLGGIVVQVFRQPPPRLFLMPLAETVNFRLMSIFLVCLVLSALFVFSATNRDAEGEAFDDNVSANQSRLVKLLIKWPRKNPILERFNSDQKKPGEAAQKHRNDKGQLGKKPGSDRSRPPSFPPREVLPPPPHNENQTRLLMARFFRGWPDGVSTVFERNGLRAGLFTSTPGLGGGRADTDAFNAGEKVAAVVFVAASAPQVLRAIDEEMIRKVIQRNHNQVRLCFEAQLLRTPGLERWALVKFIVSPEGTVKQSSVTQSTMGNAALDACVAGRVRAWRFPKPRSGSLVMVMYSFFLKHSGRPPR